jgi:hypothetical protein
MRDKVGPKEQQVRDLREQREAAKKRKPASPSELRREIAKIKPKPAKARKGKVSL